LGRAGGERRRWLDDFKDRAFAASLEPDANMSALEVTPSQLFAWRGAAVRSAAKGERRTTVEPSETKARRVEIDVGGAVLRVPADIAADDLRRSCARCARRDPVRCGFCCARARLIFAKDQAGW